MAGASVIAEGLPASRFVIRGDVMRAHGDAKTILAEAEAAAARLRGSVETERLEAIEAARREGLRQGLADAALLASHAATAIDTFWREQRAQMHEVALAVAHRILSSLPEPEILARLAGEAIDDYGRDVRITFRTAPEEATALRAALQDHGNRIVVLVDVTAKPGECTLVHPRGRTEIGLLAQFRSMLDGLSTHQDGRSPDRDHVSAYRDVGSARPEIDAGIET
ncbi:hypothetical protein LGH83_19220 [Lichenihabitans sp. PAMC28606]|uniref:FliH/SctL family protein n=1 Tax=Lichenihabitans sp. PAMC28606 TaxID=2880932 RepID=UPI001D0B0FDE|nr:hypothetical protein [Lichenihabitans sp. PAMC28606]UDL94598.1 hypothetical protein LGH83_19220 [Lichenihabitans sp. PAMC28606]